MSAGTRPIDVVRTTPVLVAIVVALVVVVVWLLAFFLPQGSKLSKLDTQETALRQQVQQGNARVAALQREALTAPKLQAELAKLKAYVPATPDEFTYPSILKAAVSAAGAHFVSVTIGSEALPVAGSSPGSFTVIPVTLDVTGTYDQLLSLVTRIYALPRLTDIPTMDITGGGPGTNRSTALTADLGLQTFTSAKPPTAS